MWQSYSRIGAVTLRPYFWGGGCRPAASRIMPAPVISGPKNMNVTRNRFPSLTYARCRPILLALVALLCTAPAAAQDACALQCSSTEAAWCTGQEFICPFNYHDCMDRCERPAPVVKPGLNILPCQYAQNALRPCDNQQQASTPAGVDSRLVGTREIVTPTAAGVARWVWEIHSDGTYSFHAEGPGAVPAHSGTFAASGGHYSLNSTTMPWNDVGTYQLQGATMVVNGEHGAATWQRVQAKAAVRPGSQPITIRK